MNKKILKPIIFLFAFIAFLSSSRAANIVNINNQPVTQGIYTFEGHPEWNKKYGTYNYITLDNGQKAYCLDPGQDAINSSNYTCRPVTSSDNYTIPSDLRTSLLYLFSQDLDDVTNSLAVKQLSFLHDGQFAFSKAESECAYIALNTASFREADIYDYVNYGDDECENVKVSVASGSGYKKQAQSE